MGCGGSRENRKSSVCPEFPSIPRRIPRSKSAAVLQCINMVDLNKQLSGGGAGAKPIVPTEIYEKADRESDTGPLRPAQIAVLNEWHSKRRAERDVIIKMHTGQGKTLIGLLILQSKMNETEEPAVYICPNIYLVQQTVAQGKRFGIRCCTADRDLPEAFTDGQQILVTTVQKLFNGITKFGIGGVSLTEAVGENRQHVGPLLHVGEFCVSVGTLASESPEGAP